MIKRFFCVFLAMLMLLSALAGCKDTTALRNPAENQAQTAAPDTLPAEPTVPATTPADGDPSDVTCKGSYTAAVSGDAVVAAVSQTEPTAPPEEEEAKAAAATEATEEPFVPIVRELTGAMLQVFYQMEVNSWRQEIRHNAAPDFSRPLDTQACPIDDSVHSWQQYFLQRALNTWHTVQALSIQAEAEGVPTEPAYQPNPRNHKEYLTEKPATRWLYGYNKSYSPNEKHQAYLDEIPALLNRMAADRGYANAAALAQAMGTTAAELEEAVRLYNFGYMYFTTLGYDLEPTEEQVQAMVTSEDTGRSVTIRHMLFLPKEAAEAETGPKAADATEAAPVEQDPRWEACRLTAQAMIARYEQELKDNAYNALKTTEESIFAELANEFSEDEGSRSNGGAYRDIRQGQLIDALDSWCFDPARQYGDVTTIRSSEGYHILFFSSSQEIRYAEAEAAATAALQTQLIADAREACPMEVDYSAITLAEAADTISSSDVLYPDIAHERFPVVPLYLQQDYPTTKYGAYKITSHGCGITTMAMLASYMGDDDYTPPRLCAEYEDFVYSTGTDGRLFVIAPAEMNFYLRKRTYEWREAYAALEEGYIVVVVQQKGFWTRGGHYLVLEKLLEDGRIQVRDSNMYNYGRLHDHRIDSFEWSTITPQGKCYWIYENKVVTIPACSRCGEEGASQVLTSDYVCEKCAAALLRRDTFLSAAGA